MNRNTNYVPMPREQLEELEEFIVCPSISNALSPSSFSWNEKHTKLLLDHYADHRGLVGSYNIKNFKKMWEIIANKMSRELGMVIAPNHCENRWRVVERSYKKFIDDQKSTGRSKKLFAYREEMERIFGNKRNITPELVLGAQDVHEIQENVAREDKENTNPTEGDRPIVNPLPPKRKRSIESITGTITKKKLNIEEEKVELLKSKLQFMRETHEEKRRGHNRSMEILDKIVNHQVKILSNQEESLSYHDESLSNQEKMLSNQEESLSNQEKMLSNQEESLSNQEKILSNQEKILSNQEESLSNEKKILSNQEESSSNQKKILSDLEKLLSLFGKK